MSPKKSAISKLVEGLSAAERQEVLDLAAQIILGEPATITAELWGRIEAIRTGAERRARIRSDEPANQRIVRFSHRFTPGGRVYTYAAIRADNPRGERRWFLTGADYLPMGGHRGIASPATWVEIVEFALPHTILVAPLNAHWRPLDNRPAAETSSRSRIADYSDDPYTSPYGDDLRP